MKPVIARSIVVFVVVAEVVFALVGCSSAAAPTAGPSSSSSSPTPRSAAPPATATPSTDNAASRPATGSPRPKTATRTVDPADYHDASVGPGSARFYDARTVSFQTPSHNIRCTAIAAGAQITCETVRHTFPTTPRPKSCTHNWLGSDVSVGARPATIGVCASNPIVLSNSAVLPYHGRLTYGHVSCTSEASALTCIDGRHGFELSRARAVVH